MLKAAHFQEVSLAITTTVTKQGAYSIMKISRETAVSGVNKGSFLMRLASPVTFSAPASPMEYAVPRVDTITSFAANPPIRAILVRQSNPADSVTGSRARPARPANEWASSARARVLSISFNRFSSRSPEYSTVALALIFSNFARSA